MEPEAEMMVVWSLKRGVIDPPEPLKKPPTAVNPYPWTAQQLLAEQRYREGMRTY